MNGMKDILDAARAAVVSGQYPKAILASNKKTGYSVMDNVPQLTCYGICPIRSSCYDVRILNLRPNVLKARAARHFTIQYAPEVYIGKAVSEIRAKSLRSVRIYGGGDFAPAHTAILARIMAACPDTTFYMISKTIRSFPGAAEILLAHPNFFLNLSECSDYHFGPEWSKVRSHPRVNTVYTLLEKDRDFARAASSDIVFNVSKSAKNIASYKAKALPLCPCDAKDIPSVGACGSCNLCHTKGGVRGS